MAQGFGPPHQARERGGVIGFGLIGYALATYLWLTRPNVKRLCAIMREEIDKDLLRRSGLTGDAAIAYAAALNADRFKTSNPSEDRHA